MPPAVSPPAGAQALMCSDVRRRVRTVLKQLECQDLERQLDRIRGTRIAETVDELEDGFAGVTTVVRAPGGRVLGSLSIWGPTECFDWQRRASLAERLLSTMQQFRVNSRNPFPATDG